MKKYIDSLTNPELKEKFPKRIKFMYDQNKRNAVSKSYSYT